MCKAKSVVYFVGFFIRYLFLLGFSIVWNIIQLFLQSGLYQLKVKLEPFYVYQRIQTKKAPAILNLAIRPGEFLRLV